MRFDIEIAKSDAGDDAPPSDFSVSRSFVMNPFLGDGAHLAGSLTGYVEILDAAKAIVPSATLTGTLWIYDPGNGKSERGAWVKLGAVASLPSRQLAEWKWSGFNAQLRGFMQFTSIVGAGAASVAFFAGVSGVRS